MSPNPIVCDLEANGLLHNATTAWCAVIHELLTGNIIKFGPDQINELLDYLTNKTRLIIGHNFIDYDVSLLKKLYNFEFPKGTVVIDTYIISQLVTPDRKRHPRTSKKKSPHSLENFGNIFKRYKPAHEDWSQYSPEMLHRCSEDVEINVMAHKMLNRTAQLVKDDGTFNTKSPWLIPYKIEARFAKCFVDQKEHGVLLNRRRVNRYINYLTAKMDAIDLELVPQLPKQLIIEEGKNDDGTYKYKRPFKGDGELNKHTLDWCNSVGIKDTSIISGPFSRIHIVDFDLGSRNLVVNYLLSEGWIPEKWNTKEDPVTGHKRRTSPKLSQSDAFLGVEGPVGKLVAKRVVYRHRRSQLEGFLKVVRDDGRIPAEATGMTPTARLRHAKVVNIPGSEAIFGEQMRSCFTVPKGYKLVGCDAKSCQLRDLCHHMEDDDYTYAVVHGKSEDGTDPHSLTCKLTGIPHRVGAKRFNYGSLFGAGVPKLTGMINEALAEKGLKTRVTEADVKGFKDKFMNGLPKYKELLRRLSVQFNTYGYIIGADGRRIFPRSEHQVLCYLLQSDEAIAMKVGYLYLYSWIKERNLDANIVVFMHDEWQVEVRDDHAQEVAELAMKAIEKAHEWLQFNIPFEGDASIGKHWGETH